MSVAVDFTQWGSQYLAPGADAWWWYTWIFDSNHWQRMSAAPDNNVANIQIVEEWSEKDTWGTTLLHVHWRNNGTTGVWFRPTVIVAPSRY